MLAKRTTTPTVFSGAIALIALSGCSLQDYDYLGAGNKTDDKTEEPDETEETTEVTTSPDSSVETTSSETTDVTSGPDASATEVTEETTSTTEVTSSSVPVPSSEPEPTSSATSETTVPPDPTSTVDESSDVWVPGPVVVDPYNLLTGSNATFEGPASTAKGDWLPLGGAVLAASSASAYTGTQSMFCQGRTQNWEGPSIEAVDLLEHGKEYIASGWVRSEDGSGQPFHIVRKAICVYDGGAVETRDSVIYTQLASTYATGEWTQLVTPPFKMPSCDLQTFTIYFEGPAAMKKFYLDDVAIVPVDKGDAGL